MGEEQTERPAIADEYFQRPSPARFWNYVQGGRDNYPLDRSTGDAFASAFPEIFNLARQAQRYLMRAVHAVATEGGVRQFLDVGCGLPAPSDLADTHQVAQAVHPDARVVYVDNDPVVRAHVQAWVGSSTPEGTCVYLEADAHDPAFILAEAAKTLDFDKPVGVILFGLLGHIADFDEACSIVDQLMAAVPSGSYLLVHDGVDNDAAVSQGIQNRNETGIQAFYLRTDGHFRRYFRGLELLEPGLVSGSLWRPDAAEVGSAQPVGSSYGGVARKP
ncbi:SAM-dependent methyltransferase [Pseudonocardia acaciae]|uniref:SAM-dependent methyltransferase n=1 Tax=Pseudonocardia acaciae TaxID=551276 RepID=UPI000ADED2B5|nr:SAM-dependent methyltransferase [Pseudonocardia acaciae]